MKLSSPTIIITLLALILLGGGYWYFSSSQTGNEPPISSGATINTAQMKFQSLVNELQPITFDTSIFSNPGFNALADIATPVTREPTGRLDPFAPVAGISTE